MSILKSMNIGLSGLAANGNAMGVIGDNIANVNTVGFKGSRTNFSDVFAGTVLGVGDGVRVGSIQQQFNQGSLELTGNVFDLAISGDGFFMVEGNVNGEQGKFYTRAGQFGVDSEGFIANQSGLRLIGYEANSVGELSPRLTELQIGERVAPPSATTQVVQQANLDAGATQIDRAVTPFDPADPATFTYVSSITVFDSLGNEIPVDVYYTRTTAGDWETIAQTDGENVAGGVAGTPSTLFTGALTFDVDGNLTAGGTGTFTFDPAAGAPGQAIALDFTGTTQYAGDTTLRFASQDGFSSGDIVGVDIQVDGTVMGLFANGEQIAVGQVATATFGSSEGLARLGQNVWRESVESGVPTIGEPGTGGRGSIVAGAVEGSNVDLAYEFVRMIAAQRGFQANSQVITTADQMFMQVVSLKR